MCIYIYLSLSLFQNTTNFENFKLRIQLEQIPRDTSPVDTGLNVTSFSQDPIIQSDYYEREVWEGGGEEGEGGGEEEVKEEGEEKVKYFIATCLFRHRYQW